MNTAMKSTTFPKVKLQNGLANTSTDRPKTANKPKQSASLKKPPGSAKSTTDPLVIDPPKTPKKPMGSEKTPKDFPKTQITLIKKSIDPPKTPKKLIVSSKKPMEFTTPKKSIIDSTKNFFDSVQKSTNPPKTPNKDSKKTLGSTKKSETSKKKKSVRLPKTPLPIDPPKTPVPVDPPGSKKPKDFKYTPEKPLSSPKKIQAKVYTAIAPPPLPQKKKVKPKGNPVEEEKVPIPFYKTKTALNKQQTEIDMVEKLEVAKTYDDVPIWITFRLWQYDENYEQLAKLMKMGIMESCGDDIADMKRLMVYHGMQSCLDCFMIDDDSNMRTVGFIIDDDVLVSFNTVLPYMTQYNADFLERFYGKTAEQNSVIRQWLNYCVRNIRGRRISEYMWQEMETHLNRNAFFGGPYRTMADTLLYLSLYPAVKRWIPVDFSKRYNLSRWFRMMQADDHLRGANELLEISRTSKHHPNYPFYGQLPDSVDPEVL